MLSGNNRQAGFTFLGLLFLISLMGIGMAVTGVVWQQDVQRDKERELLFIGDQFRQAIGNYYERTPGTVKAYPKSLEDLLQDKRYVTTQRHLRKIYLDPITGSHEWGLVRRPDGALIGIYSLSQDTPIKAAGFDPNDNQFQQAKQYADWKFVYVPRQSPAGAK
jgi:type II secretory pathway pseudopilin PulG